MTQDSKGPRRILSGVQPSGKLHLGNYFGAVKQHIALQDEAEVFYFIADYHALTTIQDPKSLKEHTRDVALDYLALGLDPDKATFFRQSDVPEVKPLHKTVMHIETDSTPLGSPLNPDTCNVFTLYSLFATPDEKAQLAELYRSGSIGYGEAKKRLLAKINEYFEQARQRRKQLAADANYVEDVLRRGAQKARAEAQKTMELVRQAVGMKPRPVT